MKSFLLGTAAALALSGAASAATLVATTGTPLTYAVHNPGPAPDGNLLVEDTNPGGFLIDYTSTSILHNNGNSGGFATVTGVGGIGGAGFVDLTIDPENPIVGFTGIKFNLILPHDPTEDNGTHATFDWDTRVYFLGGGFQDFLDTATAPPQRYLVSDPGQIMTRIVFSNFDVNYTLDGVLHVDAPFHFDGIEQVSLDGLTTAVPEPATWAMMLVGFFGMGGLLRKRRALAVA